MKRPKFRLPQLSATRLGRHMASDSSGQLAAQAVAAALLASETGNAVTASARRRRRVILFLRRDRHSPRLGWHPCDAVHGHPGLHRAQS
jgi:hypothetical protein